jgi:integrase
LAELRTGTYLGPDVDKTTYDDLERLILDNYAAHGRRSLTRLALSCAHLRAFFGGLRARAIPERLDAYVSLRRGEQAANASINRELAALRRMVRLGVTAKKLTHRLDVEMLHEDNVRTGFFERASFEAVRARLPADEQPVADVAYLTGWRVPSELLTRRWTHVDFTAGWLRLEPGETKNGDGRQFPLTPDLRRVLEAQRARTLAVERATGQIIPWVFHRSGAPIKSLYGAWRAACTAAGHPGMLMHDFRRTAVRNLERAGVPRSAAMKMTGHKTEAVYRRYAIVDEAMLTESGAKLQAFHDLSSADPATPRVVALRRGAASNSTSSVRVEARAGGQGVR